MSLFFAGGVVGAWAFGRVGYDTLYLPALLTGAMALGYVACRRWSRAR